MNNEIFISVILIVNNQTNSLVDYIRRLSPYLSANYSDYEIVIIDQNSKDDRTGRLDKLLTEYQSIRHIRLSQKVSLDVALAAGIENAIGDFVVNLNIDTDNFELILLVVEKGVSGNDIVMCVSEKVTSFIYRISKKMGIYLLKSIGYSLPDNSTGTFCFSRRAINAITESSRFYCKLYINMMNTGYPIYPFECDDYINKSEKKSIIMGLQETMHHMVFNSTKPLRWMSLLGLGGSLMAMLFSIYSILIHFIKDEVASGWTTTVFFMSFLFSILFVMFSFFGEYLARLLDGGSEHKEYNVVYERNSSVMLNENRKNILFHSNIETMDSRPKRVKR